MSCRPRSCRSIDLNRKGLIEEDGDSLAGMLKKNKGDGDGVGGEFMVNGGELMVNGD